MTTGLPVDDLWKGAIYGTIVGTAIGFPLGAYTNIFVHRWGQFYDLKREARRVLAGIEFVGSDHDFELRLKREPSELLSISTDMQQLGHRRAGEEVFALMREIQDILDDVKNRRKPFRLLCDRDSTWTWRLSRLHPSYRAIFGFNFRR
jgi:hypothetical protein